MRLFWLFVVGTVGFVLISYFEQVPVLVLQVPTSWHWSLAAHVTGFDPAQVPAWQVSV